MRGCYRNDSLRPNRVGAANIPAVEAGPAA